MHLPQGSYLPAMIGAPDAILLDKSVVEGRAAMGAVLADKTVIPL